MVVCFGLMDVMKSVKWKRSYSHYDMWRLGENKKIDTTVMLLKSQNEVEDNIQKSDLGKRFICSLAIGTGLVFGISNVKDAEATTSTIRIIREVASDAKVLLSSPQSPGWELARQKRTAAIKDLAVKGILEVDTDDAGNQFLRLPWIPDRKIAYKSLSLQQRLQNEVCAGAFGEISKDALLHAVDTAKTRRQVKKKQLQNIETDPIIGGKGGGNNNNGLISNPATNNMGAMSMDFSKPDGFISALNAQDAIKNLRDLYAGFPVVLCTTIPQGGVFFLVKKGFIELLTKYAPTIPYAISSTVPIGFGVMAYWLFRTPAEVIKTQVQTGQSPNVREAFETAITSNPKGLLGLWKYYPVMLWLDIPFQIINFILYGVVSDAVLNAGFETSILTRLFCGVTCGMITAAVTCPIDVCKTRIISRDRQASALALATTLLDKTDHDTKSSSTIIDSSSTIELNLDNKFSNSTIQADNNQNNPGVISMNIIFQDNVKSDNIKDSITKNEKDFDLINSMETVSSIISDNMEVKKPSIAASPIIYSEIQIIDEINLPTVDITMQDNLSDTNILKNSISNTLVITDEILLEGNKYLENKEEGGSIVVGAAISPLVTTTSNKDELLQISTSNIDIISPQQLVQSQLQEQEQQLKLSSNVINELIRITKEEGVGTLFLGIQQRLLYVGLANGIRLAAYGTSRMDLMMRSLDDL